MMEYAGKLDEEMASGFITSTCQFLPKSFNIVSDQMHNLTWSPKREPKSYSILCGSQAEFYIRPLIICTSDVDYLFTKADELTFSGDFVVLPSDMSCLADTIECYKIEAYDLYPGFVRLRVYGEMNYNWRNKKYEFYHTVHRNKYKTLNLAAGGTHCVSARHLEKTLPNIISGPAITYQPDSDGLYGHDGVQSVWCPQWPLEAKNWLIRSRNSGWPTIDTISEVVRHGCHVVYVQHRSCRDEAEQWRFSFSVAEVILLQSWTTVQQIVYHLLRFFAKRELIQKDCPKEDEVLCTYHLKTLMLWTCEEMSLEWWNSSSVVAICCELLQQLSEWLHKSHCPNYFIPEANLFHECSSSTMLEGIEKQLNKFSKSGVLGHWFVENYILYFLRRHSKLESTRKVTSQILVNKALDLFEFRKANESESLDIFFSLRFTFCYLDFRFVFKYGVRSGLGQFSTVGYYTSNLISYAECIMAIYPTIEVLCFRYYDNLLYILHAAYGIGLGKISWNSNLFAEFAKAVSTQPNVKSKYHNFPKAYTARSRPSLFQFLRAQCLMENLTGSNSRPEFQLLSLMSKEFLRKSLEYFCPNCSCTAPAALAYLAALHFATSEYQQAIRFCLAVFVNHRSHKEKETLNAGCLLCIDDVARIVGLCVLHKKITENNLHCIGRRLYLDLRLSPEVLAHYLAALSAERISTHMNFHHDLPDSVFPMDEYLKTLMKSKYISSMKSDSHFSAAREIVYRRQDSLTESETSSTNPLIVKEKLFDILMEYALENMTSFYSVVLKDFGIQCNTVDCYRALYLYKYRQYDKVLDLCERILHEPELQRDLKESSFANVLVLPPLDSFFDDNVQSLLGFHTLFYYLLPLIDDMGKVYLTAESAFVRCFSRRVCFDKEELSSILIRRYSIKCRYFLGRHFLARYLKVRCCIDCKCPCSEVTTEFAVQKINFPFEHVIRRFFLQKLRINNK